MKFTGMEKVGELIQLNVLFVLCGLPIVTLGASATALHYALRRRAEGKGGVVGDFLRAFRENLRQATILWLCALALGAGLGLNFWLISGWTGPALLPAAALLGLGTFALLVWTAVVFPLLARFDNTTGATAKNALILALGSPLRSLAAAALNIAPFVLAALLPELFLLAGFLWLFLLCAVSALAAQKLFAPLFARLERAAGD